MQAGARARSFVIGGVGVVLVAGGCGAGRPSAVAAPGDIGERPERSPPSPEATVSVAEVSAAELDLPRPPPIKLAGAGFLAPEAVVYEPGRDEYLVSNVNGDPFAADQNGFISRVSPDGALLELKWIDGSRSRTSLNAPKGMAVKHGRLYVADIDLVRVFDAKTGESRGKVFVPGAASLEDIAVATDGTVYVTDSGLKKGRGGIEQTFERALFKINWSQIRTERVAQEAVPAPTGGVTLVGDQLWLVDADGAFFQLGPDGRRTWVTVLPSRELDGVVDLEDGTVLIAAQEARAIYRGRPGSLSFEPVVTGVDSPVSVAYDSKRRRAAILARGEGVLVVAPLYGPRLGPTPETTAAPRAATFVGPRPTGP